jgi:quercetin dioxygenase-like cupin family protein
MSLIEPSNAKRFAMHGATFASLVSPSRGGSRNAVWTVCIDTNSPGVPHVLSDEETFVCLSGRAVAQIGHERHELYEGCALLVPPHTAFSLTKVGEQAFRAVVVLPAAATVRIGDGEWFTPPWAQ